MDVANLMDVPPDQRPEPPSSAPGLWHLVAIVLTLATIAVVAYMTPALERVRPWVQGEGVPVVRLFTAERKAELPHFEGSAAASSAHAERQQEEQEPEEVPPEEAKNAQFGLEIAAKEYAGAPVSIEFPENLASFYKALRRSASREAGAITRVAHYGDSSIAADEITQTLRRRLQLRFGDAGHGFMLTAKGEMHYVHRDVSHTESDGWEVSTVVRRGLKSGLYGYGGVVARAFGGEYSSFGTSTRGAVGHAVSRFEIFYQRFPNGGEIRAVVDGGAAKSIRTRADATEDAWHVIEVPDGEHNLMLRTSGEVRMYGVVQERAGPGVVYDSLGLVGARADRLLDFDPAHIRGQIAHRSPNLIVLAFGGNEAGNDWLDPAKYAEGLRNVLKLMRAGAPDASCLLFSPVDQAERTPRGRIITLSVLPAIVFTQREVAQSEGCAFFDAWTAMGGEGAMEKWFESRPRLASSDLRHLTPQGYAVIGTAYYKALLEGFAGFVAKSK